MRDPPPPFGALAVVPRGRGRLVAGSPGCGKPLMRKSYMPRSMSDAIRQPRRKKAPELLAVPRLCASGMAIGGLPGRACLECLSRLPATLWSRRIRGNPGAELAAARARQPRAPRIRSAMSFAAIVDRCAWSGARTRAWQGPPWQ